MLGWCVMKNFLSVVCSKVFSFNKTEKRSGKFLRPFLFLTTFLFVGLANVDEVSAGSPCRENSVFTLKSNVACAAVSEGCDAACKNFICADNGFEGSFLTESGRCGFGFCECTCTSFSQCHACGSQATEVGACFSTPLSTCESSFQDDFLFGGPVACLLQFNGTTPVGCFKSQFGCSSCGDLILDPNEECDDGNVMNGDGCFSNCTLEPPPACTDIDNDGFNIEGGACGLVDCNDGDSSINPDALEVCDNQDNNCDGVNNEGGVCVEPALFLLIDEDSIDNGSPPNFFSDVAVNDQKAGIGLRAPLPAFDVPNVGERLILHTGEVGDEGWFALKTIPPSWAETDPTDDGLRNFVGVGNLLGPGLGAGTDPEALLDKIPDVTPLRASGLKLLEGQQVCAVVYDSDISMNYGPLSGGLKGSNLGIVALKVLSVTLLTGFSSSSLPQVEVEILNAIEVCGGDLILFTDAPEPSSSSEPFDVTP